MRNNLLLLLLLFSSILFAQTNELIEILNEALLYNEDYQQTKTRLDKEEAEAKINSSLKWFDVNLSVNKYSNEIERDETKTNLESSEITEEDERRKIELSRTFFPKDFDDSADALSSKIDLLRLRQNMIIVRSEQMDDVLSECIKYNSDLENLKLAEYEFEQLQNENLVLEELNSKQLIKPQKLINNIKKLENIEDEIQDLQQDLIKFRYTKFYDKLIEALSQLSLEGSTADTLSFIAKAADLENNLEKRSNKISKAINLRNAFFFLPELNIALSYNQRFTTQNWRTTENQSISDMDRDIEEKYPEAEIELSLPFNIFSNVSGKKALLNSFENEIFYRKQSLLRDLQEFKEKKFLTYLKRENDFERKKRLNELYKAKYDSANEQYKLEPEILGTDADEELFKIQKSAEKAHLEFETAKLKLQKEIFLINTFGE